MWGCCVFVVGFSVLFGGGGFLLAWLVLCVLERGVFWSSVSFITVKVFWATQGNNKLSFKTSHEIQFLSKQTQGTTSELPLF